jgi:hypothetical protein
MSTAISTQRTSFLPICVPVLQKLNLQKRFFSRMERIFAKRMVNFRKMDKEGNIPNDTIRYLLTHMGNIGDSSRKYYKVLAKDKENRTAIYKARVKSAKASDKKSTKLAKQVAKIDKETSDFVNNMSKLAIDTARTCAKADKEAHKITQQKRKLAQARVKAAKEEAKLEKNRLLANKQVAKAYKATAKTQKEVELAQKLMRKFADMCFAPKVRVPSQHNLGDTTVVF